MTKYHRQMVCDMKHFMWEKWNTNLVIDTNACGKFNTSLKISALYLLTNEYICFFKQYFRGVDMTANAIALQHIVSTKPIYNSASNPIIPATEWNSCTIPFPQTLLMVFVNSYWIDTILINPQWLAQH